MGLTPLQTEGRTLPEDAAATRIVKLPRNTGGPEGKKRKRTFPYEMLATHESPPFQK